MQEKILKTIKDIGSQYIKKEGETLVLSDEYIYFIESGGVNVFCSSLLEQGFFGSRVYIASFNSGELLFSAKSKIEANWKTHLIVDPLSDTKIIRIKNNPDSLFRNEILSSFILDKLCIWIKKISLFFVKERPPLSCRIFTDKEIENSTREFIIEEGESIILQRDDLCAVLNKGSFAVCGNTLSDSMLLPAGSIFPLSSCVWLKSQEKSFITFRKTEEIILERDISSCLKAFYSAFFNYFIYYRDCTRNVALEQKRNLTELEHKAMDASIEALAFLNKKTKTLINISSEAMTRPALAALEVIGNSLNIKFKFPENLSPTLKGEKLICYILEYSSVFYRKVKLQGKWWKEEGFSMICFYKDNPDPVSIIYDRKKGYLIYDYDTNKTIPLAQNDISRLDSSGYVIYPQLPIRKLKFKDIFLFACRGRKAEFYMAVILGVVGGTVSLAQAFVTGIIFNNVIPSADSFQLCQIAVILITCALTSVIFTLGQSLLILRIKTISAHNL